MMKLPAARPLDSSKLNESHMNTMLGRGMDLAIITLLFLGVGYLLDRWLGTRPWLMIVMVILALVGEFVRMKAIYEAQMRELEAKRNAGARAGGNIAR